MILVFKIKESKQLGSHNRSITHYMDAHGYIPLWVLVNILTFGRISTFYSLMWQHEQQQVAKRFNVSDKEMKTILKFMSFFRNLCAHDERLYNFRTNKDGISDTKYHSMLVIPKLPGSYKYGKKDVFALVICLKILLNKKEFQEMLFDIKRRLDKLSGLIHVVNITDILESMGFPNNWIQIKDI